MPTPLNILLCNLPSFHKQYSNEKPFRASLTIESKSSHRLRSNNGLYLEPPKGKMLKTFGARSFQAAAPYFWNRLPHEIRLIKSFDKFKKAI